jgi:hypothetical protein
MTVRFSPLTEDTLSAAKELLLPFWERDWEPDVADQIFRWRFLAREDGEAILALDEDRCVAMIDSWCRRYMVNGDMVTVRELGDWYSLPEYRGVGLQPMWMMMRKPEPIVSIGGTADTQGLLPRLGWKPLPGAASYTLELSSGVLAERLLKRLKSPGKSALTALAHKLSIPVRRVRLHSAPLANATVREYDPSDEPPEVIPPRDAYPLASLIGAKELRWIFSAPDVMGKFICLVFSINGQPVGLSLSRLFRLEHFCESKILHMQASDTSPSSYAWMASETARHLARRGAKKIQCRNSCPKLAIALHDAGFAERGTAPSYWWSRDLEAPQGTALLSLFRADDGILPYPK